VGVRGSKPNLLYGGLNAEALVRRAVEAVETLDAEGLEATQRRFD
jgi:hypothetical protein